MDDEALLAAYPSNQAVINRLQQIAVSHKGGEIISKVENEEGVQILFMTSAKKAPKKGVSPFGRFFNKPVLLFIGGTHGNEWLGITTCLHIAEQIAQHIPFLQKYEIIVIPLLNPEGYQNSRLHVRDEDVGRKTAEDATGFDMNRNWPTPGWQPYGDPTNPLYSGAQPLQSSRMRFLDKLIRTHRPKWVFDLHSFYQTVVHPFGYSNTHHEASTKYGDLLTELIKKYFAAERSKVNFAHNAKVAALPQGINHMWSSMNGYGVYESVSHGIMIDYIAHNKFCKNALVIELPPDPKNYKSPPLLPPKKPHPAFIPIVESIMWSAFEEILGVKPDQR